MNQKDFGKKWRHEQTVQYGLRFMKSTGVPDALQKASEKTGESISQYIKKSIVNRLKSEGFFHGDVVLNLNEQRHNEKIKRLEAYLEKELNRK